MRSKNLAAPWLGLAAAAVLAASPAAAQLKLPRISPKASVSQTVGLTDLSITYSRPGVKGRTLWGDLVPYDQPWRTGANEATTFTTSDPIEFGGKKLEAGTYSLLTIPGAREWTVVLNGDPELWGTNAYTSEKDVVRVAAKPTTAPHQEWLSLGFENLGPDQADLVMRWGTLQVAVPIRVSVNDRVLAAARAAMDTIGAANWRTPYQAANFTFTSDVATEEGRAWLERSLAIQKNYFNLSLKARWQAKAGRKTEALATARQALAAAKESKDRIDTAATEKLIAEWTAAK